MFTYPLLLLKLKALENLPGTQDIDAGLMRVPLFPEPEESEAIVPLASFIFKRTTGFGRTWTVIVVVFETPPLPVTVIVCEPMGVVLVVAMDNVVEQLTFGEQLVGANVIVVPVKLDAEKETV